MEGLLENRPLLYALCAAQAGILCTASTLVPDLNESLELVTEWPTTEFRDLIVCVLVVDFALSHLAEECTARAFPLAKEANSVAY